MCGFVGQCGRDNICDKDFLSNGINTLYHRGPDDFGFWYSDDFTVGLAHRRLSIIDLSTDGKQPIVSKSGRYIIVFNGEIYNHQDLLNELLISSEISLKGKSDTEILLNCIEIWGLNKTLKKLIGMFAIALYDKWEENIHLIRDRAGEKPLFYLIKKNTIYFASELKALLVNNQLPKKINIDALDCYLSLGYVPGEMCILDQYKKVPAASVITFNLKSCFLRKSKYWEIPKNEIKISKKNLTNEFTNSLVNQFEELLEDSVAKQMRADLAHLKEAKAKGIASMDERLAREEGANAVSADDDVGKLLEKQLAVAISQLEEVNSRANEQRDAVNAAAKSGTQETDNQLRDLRAEHESAVAKLQDEFGVKRKEQEETMKRKLAMRKRKKEAMLRNQNANKLDESAAPLEVQEAVVTQTQVISEAVQQGMEEEVAAINSDSSLSADEKHRRIQQVEEDYSSELHKIREQAERAKTPQVRRPKTNLFILKYCIPHTPNNARKS